MVSQGIFYSVSKAEKRYMYMCLFTLRSYIVTVAYQACEAGDGAFADVMNIPYMEI